MGYMRHHAILVSSSFAKVITEVHERDLIVFGGNVSNLIESPVNGVVTFLIPPDGSKEGWPPSIEGDNSRADFIKYLDNTQYSDRSSPLAWVELQYGDDNSETLITNVAGEFLNDSDKIVRELGYNLD